ncbi:MAG TPA: hypothetical protein VMX75_07475 [Spirochaetia bacterium]|nr:hypothetical protein [Spirochaetia bacterium]
MIKKELPDTSKRLIVYYLNESKSESMAAKARDSIVRYLQTDIPTLDEIRKRSRTSELTKLDHLILKMEYEGRQLADQTL